MKYGIFGAGSIGCFVGGMLTAPGRNVVMVGRPTMAARLWAGYEITRHDGLKREIDEDDFAYAGEAGALADCDVVFVCVKSGDTAEAGRLLANAVRTDATIVSLQNGVSNAGRLREVLPGRTVLAAMVPFNVALIGENRFHCASEGAIIIEDQPPAAAIAGELTQAGLPASTSDAIQSVLWTKLLMNLNNAVNVLSGLPLKAQLSQRDYRLALAASVSEGLAAIRAAGIQPVRIGKVRPGMMVSVLRLPDWLFAIAAANMLKIDEEARSSMADDLDMGRKPEIDYLNGAIVELGSKVGVATPVNARIVELVKEAFASGQSPKLSGKELLASLS